MILADNGVNQERGKFRRKWPIEGDKRNRRNEAFIGPSEFFHDCVPGDKSTARASLCPQIQLFGKLNLSKSRRASWCSRPLPPPAPQWKDARQCPRPLGWLSCIPLYRLFISYWQPPALPRILVYVWLDLCMYACIFIGIEWRIR